MVDPTGLEPCKANRSELYSYLSQKYDGFNREKAEAALLARHDIADKLDGLRDEFAGRERDGYRDRAGNWHSRNPALIGLEPAPVKLTETGLRPDGSLVELPDFDDATELWERDAETITASDADAENIRLKDSTFIYLSKNRAGEIVDAEVHAKAVAGQKELKESTINMALAVAAAGIPAFIPKKAPRGFIVDPASEQVIESLPVRRVNFFPTVAKARRAPMIGHLEMWLEKNPLTRMATFTIGKPTWLIADQVRDKVKFLHRRLSNLNAHALMKTHGCRMIFRASEFGTIRVACPYPRQPGTEAGFPIVHIHAHTLLTFDHQLSRRRFKRFMSKMWNLWGHHWDFGRPIENLREACKYPLKPGDLNHLAPEHVAAFYNQTKGLHLVQPMGELRELISARREAQLKFVRQRDKTGDLKLALKPDWNARHDRKTKKEKIAAAFMREKMRADGLRVYSHAASLHVAKASLLRNAAKVRCQVSPAVMRATIQAAAALNAAALSLVRFNPRPFEERRLAGIRALKAKEALRRGAPVMRNRVVARLAPAAYFDRITRPALMVWNFDGNFAALRELPFVREMIEAVRPKIAAAEAALSGDSPKHRVHTSHTTATRARAPGNDAPELLMHAGAWQAEVVS